MRLEGAAAEVVVAAGVAVAALPRAVRSCGRNAAAAVTPGYAMARASRGADPARDRRSPRRIRFIEVVAVVTGAARMAMLRAVSWCGEELAPIHPHFAKRRKKLSPFHAGRVGRLATASTTAT